MSSYKSEQFHATVGGVITDAFAEFQALRDEMREAADNMENANTGLATTAKFQALVDAADALDQFADNELDVPDAAEGLAVSYHQQVQKRKGRGTSRAVRFENATALLEAAKDAVETAMDMAATARRDAEMQAEEQDSDADDFEAEASTLRASQDATQEDQATADDLDANAASARNEAAAARQEAESYDSDHDALNTLFDELDNVLGDVQGGVEFPGMFG